MYARRRLPPLLAKACDCHAPFSTHIYLRYLVLPPRDTYSYTSSVVCSRTRTQLHTRAFSYRIYTLYVRSFVLVAVPPGYFAFHSHFILNTHFLVSGHNGA